MHNPLEKDDWQEKLAEKIKELKACQEEKNLNSSHPCDKFFECEIRRKYVKAVYESMNKGSSGGFEF